MRIDSETKKKMIEDYQASPFEVGQVVVCPPGSINTTRTSNNGTACVAVAVEDEHLIVVRQDRSLDGNKYKVAKDLVKKSILDIGANPFYKKDSTQFRAFQLSSILFNLGITSSFVKSQYPEIYLIGGKEVGDLNWNPFIYDKNGKKRYYQRDFVWSLKDKQLLIESVYQGIDCGKILIRKRGWKELEDMAKSGETELFFYDIVDGKQRLNAVEGFMKGEYPDLHGNYYGDLSARAMNAFSDHQLFAYSEMPENSKDEDVIHQFLKLNFMGVPQSSEHIEYIKSLYHEVK